MYEEKIVSPSVKDRVYTNKSIISIILIKLFDFIMAVR